MKKIAFILSLLVFSGGFTSAQANEDLINVNAAKALLEKQGLSDPTYIEEIEKERQRLYKVSIGLETNESSDSGWIWVKQRFEEQGIYEECSKTQIGKTTKFTSILTGKKVSVTCKNLGAMGIRYVDKSNQSTSAKSSSGQCWVSGYTKSNGTKVSGYYRKCRGYQTGN